jgi:hypothetical protein
MRVFRLVLVLVFGFFLTSIALAGPVDEAKVLFEIYRTLEASFDSRVADLYSDDALISNKRTYPTGKIRELTIPAPKYKDLIRTAMPLAKAKGDYSTYSEITFTEEGTGVRIKAKRFSVLKRYYSPISILVRPDSSGRWVISEELSESQPF